MSGKGDALAFSLLRFVRRLPPSELEAHFAAREIPIGSDIDWADTRASFRDSVIAAIEAFPDEVRAQVYEDFERVDQLANEVGQRALQAMIAGDAALVRRFHERQCAEARGLLVLLSDEDAFDRAFASAYADRLSHGRSWSAYQFLPRAALKTDRNSLKRLESSLSDLFRKTDGTGRTVMIDTFKRPVDSRGGHDGQMSQYSIYVEGVPETTMEFDQRELKRRVRRPVIEAAICCDPVPGTMDVVARGGREFRERMAGLFATCMLGSTRQIKPLRQRQFDLDKLKRPLAFPTDPSDGIKSVRVTLLRLKDPSIRFRRLTIEEPSADADIHATSHEWFGDRDPLRLRNWQIIKAELRIEFQPEGKDRRGKAIKVELGAPNRSNLKDQTHWHQLVSEKYLARWGLVRKPIVDDGGHDDRPTRDSL